MKKKPTITTITTAELVMHWFQIDARLVILDPDNGEPSEVLACRQEDTGVWVIHVTDTEGGRNPRHWEIQMPAEMNVTVAIG